jgi:SAM-dependent methyltransferase
VSQPSYDDYVRDEAFISDYLNYQGRYAEEPRESDKVLVSLVADAVAASGRDPVVVDIGCSTGNLLLHLRAALPDVRLVGGEHSEESLESCRANPALAGIPFEPMDVVNLRHEAAFDVAVVNAVLYLMGDDDLVRSIQGLGRMLRPGGTLVVFDFFHPYPQDLAIVERSRSHPDGLPLHFRPMEKVEGLLRGAGFDEVRFEPFEIPIDLQPGQRYGDNASGFEDLNSYTVRADDGRRLLFRGTLFQPWCHLVATKAR